MEHASCFFFIQIRLSIWFPHIQFWFPTHICIIGFPRILSRVCNINIACSMCTNNKLSERNFFVGDDVCVLLCSILDCLQHILYTCHVLCFCRLTKLKHILIANNCYVCAITELICYKCTINLRICCVTCQLMYILGGISLLENM
jgi:hypothetical protein